MFKVWISWVSVKDMKNYSIKYLGSREALEKRRLHHIQKVCNLILLYIYIYVYIYGHFRIDSEPFVTF